MQMMVMLRTQVALLVIVSCLLQHPQRAAAGPAAAPGSGAVIERQPAASSDVQPYLTDEAALPRERMIALLRQHVKYVFVLFQENRSFDSYFGSFPGARGLFSQPPEQTPGYTQPIQNTDGTMTTVQPFRLGPEQYAADLDDVAHDFVSIADKMHLVGGIAQMDRYALVEERKYVPAGQNPSLRAKQYGELTMAYEDCDTVPFLWNYANRFVLFDNFFQHTVGPSTPNAIAMIAGQTGETEWVKHPETGSDVQENAARDVGEPLVSDANPLWGSHRDPTATGMPVNPRDRDTAALNQTYASLPLTFEGRSVGQTVSADRAPAIDLPDVQQDIPAIAAHGTAALPWGWYQEGYDHEPTDPADAPDSGRRGSYIAHHNGPQYFGYVANNPQMTSHLHGLDDWFKDVDAGRLPEAGGVFYVRGGFKTLQGLAPALKDAEVQHHFQGDDDHPGYSDSHLSEALVAREVNAIARSRYWSQSAIVMTYDEAQGDYDHVPPQILEYDPQGRPLSRGPRIPAIVISPYGRAHVISHESGDHNSVIKLVELLFDLPPMADLPDELAARLEGEVRYHQAYLGPGDDQTPGVGDMLSAFDPARLSGTTPPLPSSYAEIADADVGAVPPYADQGCKAIGMVPTDVARGVHNPIPPDFNPRPTTMPTQ